MTPNVHDKVSRLFFLDNLRVVLIILVVAHHSAQPWTTSSWFFQDSEKAPILDFFLRGNALFFMGLLFFISGFFHPPSYNRKRARAFLQDRVLRLGIPTALYALIVLPIIKYIFVAYYYKNTSLSFIETLCRYHYCSSFSFGHMWFAEQLLLYAVLYTIWRLVNSFFSAQAGDAPPPRSLITPSRFDLGILAWMLSLGMATFFIRIWFPPDDWTWMFGFLEVECAHLPQYVSLFILGIVAYHKNLMRRMPLRSGVTWGLAGLLLLCLSPLFPADIAFAASGFNRTALFAAFHESLICTGLCVGLIVAFRNFFDRKGSFFGVLSRNSYSVYIVHVPIVLAVQWPVSLLELGPIPKFLITLSIAAPLSFAFSELIRTKIPYANSIV